MRSARQGERSGVGQDDPCLGAKRGTVSHSYRGPFDALPAAQTWFPGLRACGGGSLWSGGHGGYGYSRALRGGVIYDGRSIVLGLAGLFGGPVTAVVAALMSGAYRLYLGGAGTVVGLLVIGEAAAFGVILHFLRRRDERWVGLIRLWAFGVMIHVVMLALQLALPAGMGWAVLGSVGPPVLILFPLGFVLM